MTHAPPPLTEMEQSSSTELLSICLATGYVTEQVRQQQLTKTEWNPLCTMVTAERGIGKTRESADGGVTLRQKREVRDTAAMPICCFSGHKLADIEGSNCRLKWFLAVRKCYSTC